MNLRNKTIQILSTIELPLRRDDQLLSFIYNGSSMGSTFTRGQYLYIRPGVKQISRNDVIVYKNHIGNGYTVHRVVKIIDSMIYTRGDANPLLDRYPVSFKNIIGKVEALQKDGHKIIFNQSSSKLFYIHARWTLFYLRAKAKKIFRPGYIFFKNFFINTKIAKYIYLKNLKKIVFQFPDGKLIKFVFRGKTVAQWRPDQNLFFCKKPFDIIIPKPKNNNNG